MPIQSTSATCDPIQLLQRICLAILQGVAAAGPAGAPGGHLYAAMLAQGASKRQYDEFMGALVAEGSLRRVDDFYWLTPAGARSMERLGAKYGAREKAHGCPDNWKPEFQHSPHGGFYIVNITYPDGTQGCVSNEHADGRWRIDNEPFVPIGADGDRSFPDRESAARAEWGYARACWAAAPAVASPAAPPNPDPRV